MNFKFLPPAAQELKDAVTYYESKVPGLGFDFISEVHAAIWRILAHPEAWKQIAPGIRRCRTTRFPYGLVYTVDTDCVVIISVMHLHRHPKNWRKNLKMPE